MIVFFCCADNCFDHLFLVSVKDWKRMMNKSYGKLGYDRIDVSDMWRFETLGM